MQYVGLEVAVFSWRHKTKRPESSRLGTLCGQRWIRTTEGVRQQIYSLPHLATLEFALIFLYLVVRLFNRSLAVAVVVR